MILERISKIWTSKSWISTQIQDWAQIMVLEIVYLLLRPVFEITTITTGTQIANYRVLYIGCFRGTIRDVYSPGGSSRPYNTTELSDF